MRNVVTLMSVALATCVLAASSFAQESQWKVVQTKDKEISNPEKIAYFLADHQTPDFEALRSIAVSRILAGLPVDKVISVVETTQTLKWVGPTKCGADDSRLLVETTGYNFKFESGHGSGSAMSPVEADPCSVK